MTRVQYSVAWVPCNPELSENRLFDLAAVRDNAIERFVKANELICSQGVISNTIDCYQSGFENVDVVIFYGISSELKWLLKIIKSNPHVKLVNIPIEPPVIAPLHNAAILYSMPFDRILVWNDDLVKKSSFFIKANIGEAMIYAESIPFVSFRHKNFLVAITSSKLIKHENGIHQERFHAFDFFSMKPEGIDLYGVGWDKTSYSFVKTSYLGMCDKKKEVLQNYKFSICFENAKGYPGLITEKIFDCFAAGTVPIYYGAPNVQDYIPKSCFIDFQNFKNYEELYQFLITITESEYQNYLDAAKAFIKSPEYYEFTSKRFAEIIYEQIQSLMHEPKLRRSVTGFKWSLFKIVLHHPLFFLKNLNQCRRFLFDLFFYF